MPAPESEPALTDAEVTERLEYITTALDDAEWYADLWYYGFASVFTGLAISYTVIAVQPDLQSKGLQADAAASAIKPLFGALDLLFLQRTDARFGAEELAPLPAGTPAERRAKLARAEELLRRNAAQTDTKWEWFNHVGNILLNLGAGLVVWLAFDEPMWGGISTAVGIVGGEAYTLLRPWQAVDDLAEYERRFNGGSDAEAPAVSWMLAPTGNGFVFSLSF